MPGAGAQSGTGRTRASASRVSSSSAHPSTPAGRGRGVVIGMLGCFLVGLLWICTFYVFSNDLSSIPVMNDLGQYNLVVGIALMAVGFTFATRWE